MTDHSQVEYHCPEYDIGNDDKLYQELRMMNQVESNCLLRYLNGKRNDEGLIAMSDEASLIPPVRKRRLSMLIAETENDNSSIARSTRPRIN